MKTPKDKPDKPPGQEKPPGHPGNKPPEQPVEPPPTSGDVSIALTGNSLVVNPGDVA